MNPFDREYHVARVLAGGSLLTIDGVRYRLAAPDAFARLEAARVQREAAREAELEGVPWRDRARGMLVERGLWSREGQARIDELETLVDDAKAALYRGRDRPDEARLRRSELAALRAELARLEEARGRLDGETVEAYARSAYARVLTGLSLLRDDGSPYWDDPEEGWRRPDAVLEVVMHRVAAERLSMAGVRELARSDEWNAVWNTRHADASLFGRPAADLTDEQRTLASWSLVYENVARRPDAPPRDAFADDDLFDGWMVIERREREKEDLEAQFDRLVGDKVRGKDEIFMVMDPKAREGTLRSSPSLLAGLNDAEAATKKGQRLAYLKEKGVVAEADMPDTRRNNQMAMAQLRR